MTIIDVHDRLVFQFRAYRFISNDLSFTTVPSATPTAFQFFAFSTLLWLLIVRAFRWRRYNAIHEKYGKKWNEGKGSLTPDEAQEIVNLSSMWDMPLLMNRALSFSLFKTFAIVGFSLSTLRPSLTLTRQPSIAKLLLKTAETSTSKTVTKRYADVSELWFIPRIQNSPLFLF